jgi:hypothetical protein
MKGGEKKMKIELLGCKYKLKGINLFGIIITTRKQLENMEQFDVDEVHLIDW